MRSSRSSATSSSTSPSARSSTRRVIGALIAASHEHAARGSHAGARRPARERRTSRARSRSSASASSCACTRAFPAPTPPAHRARRLRARARATRRPRRRERGGRSSGDDRRRSRRRLAGRRAAACRTDRARPARRAIGTVTASSSGSRLAAGVAERRRAGRLQREREAEHAGRAGRIVPCGTRRARPTSGPRRAAGGPRSSARAKLRDDRDPGLVELRRGRRRPAPGHAVGLLDERDARHGRRRPRPARPAGRARRPSRPPRARARARRARRVPRARRRWLGRAGSRTSRARTLIASAAVASLVRGGEVLRLGSLERRVGVALHRGLARKTSSSSAVVAREREERAEDRAGRAAEDDPRDVRGRPARAARLDRDDQADEHDEHPHHAADRRVAERSPSRSTASGAADRRARARAVRPGSRARASRYVRIGRATPAAIEHTPPFGRGGSGCSSPSAPGDQAVAATGSGRTSTVSTTRMISSTGRPGARGVLADRLGARAPRRCRPCRPRRRPRRGRSCGSSGRRSASPRCPTWVERAAAACSSSPDAQPLRRRMTYRSIVVLLQIVCHSEQGYERRGSAAHRQDCLSLDDAEPRRLGARLTARARPRACAGSPRRGGRPCAPT